MYMSFSFCLVQSSALFERERCDLQPVPSGTHCERSCAFVFVLGRNRRRTFRTQIPSVLQLREPEPREHHARCWLIREPLPQLHRCWSAESLHHQLHRSRYWKGVPTFQTSSFLLPFVLSSHPLNHLYAFALLYSGVVIGFSFVHKFIALGV